MIKEKGIPLKMNTIFEPVKILIKMKFQNIEGVDFKLHRCIVKNMYICKILLKQKSLLMV